jgi:hypothetical protein
MLKTLHECDVCRATFDRRDTLKRHFDLLGHGPDGRGLSRSATIIQATSSSAASLSPNPTQRWYPPGPDWGFGPQYPSTQSLQRYSTEYETVLEAPALNHLPRSQTAPRPSRDFWPGPAFAASRAGESAPSEEPLPLGDENMYRYPLLQDPQQEPTLTQSVTPAFKFDCLLPQPEEGTQNVFPPLQDPAGEAILRQPWVPLPDVRDLFTDSQLPWPGS